jgi:hypothetical protein
VNAAPLLSPTGRGATRSAPRPATNVRQSITRSLGPNSGARNVTPVTLAPGCPKLATSPSATGSAIAATTIGVVSVAFFAAKPAGVPPAQITSIFRRRSSRTRSGNADSCPKRSSMTTLRPSTYPVSRRPSRTAVAKRLATGAPGFACQIKPTRAMLLAFDGCVSAPRGAARTAPRPITNTRRFTYSMTWSARSSSDGGMVSPSAFAVLRFMTNSNFVGCPTGSSAGLLPRRILSA